MTMDKTKLETAVAALKRTGMKPASTRYAEWERGFNEAIDAALALIAQSDAEAPPAASQGDGDLLQTLIDAREIVDENDPDNKQRILNIDRIIKRELDRSKNG